MEVNGQHYPFKEPTGPNGQSEWMTEQIWTQHGGIKCLLQQGTEPQA